MRKLSMLLIISFTLFGMSCKESNKKMEGDVVVEKSSESAEKSKEKYILNKNAVSFESLLIPKIFDAYQLLSEDLVNTDFESAKKHTPDLIKALEDAEVYVTVENIANELAQTQNIESFRAVFYELSMALEPIFKEEIRTGEIYVQYCPMAFDNSGAYWFSTDQEIMNPYFGDVMLHCGEVKETIKSEKSE